MNIGKKIICISIVVMMIFTVFGAEFAFADIDNLSIAPEIENTGNVFFEKKDVLIKVNYSNTSNGDMTLRVDYSYANNADGEALGSLSRSVTVPANGSCTDVYKVENSQNLLYGTYTLYVSAFDADNNVKSAEIPFSVCVKLPDGKSNDKTGINAHFTKNDLTKVDIDKTYPMLESIGIKNFRESMYWYVTEQSKGVYTEHSRYKKPYDRLTAEDAGILTLFGFGNNLYTNYCEDENCPDYNKAHNRHMPHEDDDTARYAFAKYVVETLKMRPQISVAEIWNEPDIDPFNTNLIVDGRDMSYKTTVTDSNGNEHNFCKEYVLLLKEVYEAVSAYNTQYSKNVKVAGPAVSNLISVYDNATNNNKSWLRAVMECDIDGDGKGDAHKYFDVITLHHYKASTMNSDVFCNAFESVKNILSNNGAADKPVYHTEVGARLSDGENDLYKQADLYAKYYLFLVGNNYADRVYIYNFADYSGEVSSTSITESGRAFVPYSARPSFLAIANINNLLCDTEDGEVIQSSHSENGINVVKFDKKNNKGSVYAFYTVSGEGVYKYTPQNANVHFTDVFGNEINIPVSDDGAGYDIAVTSSPVYATENFNPQNKLDITKQSGKIHVKGTIAASGGDSVGVKVYGKTGKTVYINQFVLDGFGKFEFYFTPSANCSNYYVNVGTAAFSEIYVTDIDTAVLKNVAIGVYAKGSNPDSLAGLDDAKEFSLKVFCADDSVDFGIALAGFNNNCLKSVRMIDKSMMNLSDGGYEILLKKDDFGDVDSINIFALDSLQTIIPLARALRFS